MMSFGDLGPSLIPTAAGPYSPLPSMIPDDELSRGLAWARRPIDADRAPARSISMPGTGRSSCTGSAPSARCWIRFRPIRRPWASTSASCVIVALLRPRSSAAWRRSSTSTKWPAHPRRRSRPRSSVNCAGLRRQTDDDRQDRAAIERETATALASKMLDAVRATSPDAPPLYDLRDVAIFTLGWLSALRRSNIGALRRRDVVIKRDDLRQRRYLEIFVATSKTDQERKGRYVIVNELPVHEPLCAVRALEDWLAATTAREADGPLFPTFASRRTAGHLTDNFIDGRDVALAVKRIATKAALPGVDPNLLATHALRRGFATSAINKGVRRSLVREHGAGKRMRCSIGTRASISRATTPWASFLNSMNPLEGAARVLSSVPA